MNTDKTEMLTADVRKTEKALYHGTWANHFSYGVFFDSLQPIINTFLA